MNHLKWTLQVTVYTCLTENYQRCTTAKQNDIPSFLFLAVSVYFFLILSKNQPESEGLPEVKTGFSDMYIFWKMRTINLFSFAIFSTLQYLKFSIRWKTTIHYFLKISGDVFKTVFELMLWNIFLSFSFSSKQKNALGLATKQVLKLIVCPISPKLWLQYWSHLFQGMTSI